MRDLAFVAFLAGLLAFGFRRPFMFVLGYAYIDIVSPQRLSYFLINSIPISLIFFVAALLGWAIADDKSKVRLSGRQCLMLALLVYAGVTTANADFPIDAAAKWAWAWKAIVFAIFLPLTLYTRLRIEAIILFLVLSAAAIIVVGGIKTAVTGGGYGAFILMVDNNTGLYESSIISMAAIAIIPIILWLARHGTVFPRDWRVRTFAYCLIFACLLMPIGTQARTGVVCIAALALLMIRDAKRRLLYLAMLAVAGMVAVPLLPQSFTSRMETMETHQADASAATRLAVWAWTWDYAKEHPLGGGFDAYRGNRLRVEMRTEQSAGEVSTVRTESVEDNARAYHSSYFEMLGEQGFPGLTLFLLIHTISLVRMEALRRRYRGAPGEDEWIAPLAAALQNAQIIYLVGSLFVGIAFQPFIYMLLGIQIGFDQYVRKLRYAKAKPGFGGGDAASLPAGAA